MQSMALGTRASVVVAHGLRRSGLRALEHRVSSCGARASVVVHTGSVVVARRLSSCGSWALERRLSSCGTWA